ncbi:MAG: hypothetical protein AB7O96_07340 [Pseudobdellovibrionaceae bacterium]
MDLMMPVMGGIEFQQEKQKDLSLAAIPVIVMTASDSSDDRAVAHTTLGQRVFEETVQEPKCTFRCH